MTVRKTPKPSDLELQILRLLWDADRPLAVREIRDSLSDGRKRAYTTVLTVMQIMDKKGLVRREADGNRHLYHPVVQRQAVMGSLARNLIQTLFGGSPVAAMQTLLTETALSRDEIAEIRRLVDQAAEDEIVEAEGRSQS